MRVSFYATLEPIVGQRKVELPLAAGSTVANLVDVLAARWPELREHLMDQDGGLSRRVNIFVGGRNVRWLEGLQTRLELDQTIDIFPPVAGG